MIKSCPNIIHYIYCMPQNIFYNTKQTSNGFSVATSISAMKISEIKIEKRKIQLFFNPVYCWPIVLKQQIFYANIPVKMYLQIVTCLQKKKLTDQNSNLKKPTKNARDKNSVILEIQAGILSKYQLEIKKCMQNNSIFEDFRDLQAPLNLVCGDSTNKKLSYSCIHFWAIFCHRTISIVLFGLFFPLFEKQFECIF